MFTYHNMPEVDDLGCPIADKKKVFRLNRIFNIAWTMVLTRSDQKGASSFCLQIFSL